MADKYVFIDQIGRTIIGELVNETSSTVDVQNPAMIVVQPLENGQLQVKIYPLFFTEFVSEQTRNRGTTWTFNKAYITTTSDTVVDERLKRQYDSVFGKAEAVSTTAEPPTIKLFDDPQ